MTVSVEDFDLSPTVASIMYNNDLSSPDRLLLALEMYKFKTREEVLTVLREHYPSTMRFENIELLSLYDPLPEVKEKIRDLQNKFDVIIDFTDMNSARIIVSVVNPVSIHSVSMSLVEAQNLEVVYVTPLNYRELAGQDIEDAEWDHHVLLRRLVLECLSLGGTDLHIDTAHVDLKPVYPVYFRINGDLEECTLFKFTKAMNRSLVVGFIATMTNANEQDLEQTSGLQVSAHDIFGDGEVSLRATANKVFGGGYSCIFRIQTLKTVSKVISELGFPEKVQKDLRRTIRKVGGLTLITGSINTGKSTTIFAMGNEMVKMPIKIAEYSSPVEVLMPYSQAEYSNVNHLVNLVKLTKKKDVDVVIINELPSPEVAAAAFDLFNSSVHVITTTHLNRLWNIPHKLNEYFGEDYRNILSQMNLVVNQRMFHVQCPYCANITLTSAVPDLYPEFGELYYQILQAHGIVNVHINEGCDRCKNGSLKGQPQPYVEHLLFTPELVSELLRFDKPYLMEQYLRNLMFENKQALEFSVCKAIGEGKLTVQSLESLL